MKIFVTSTGENLESTVDPKFGRCNYYIIYDTEKKEFEVKENPYKTGQSSVGISVAQLAINNNCSVAISVNYGPNAFRVLSEGGVKTYKAKEDMKVKDAIEAYLKGELEEVNNPVSHEQAEKIFPHHHHHDD